MSMSFNDPFDALFALQRALDARLGSDWIGRGTAAGGSYPPVNISSRATISSLSSKCLGSARAI